MMSTSFTKMKSIGASLSWARRVIGGLASLTLVLLLSVQPCLAQPLITEPPQVASSVTHLQGPTDPQELEAFLDNFFAQQMANLHIPGAAFALVKDGKIFFTKGYGYADLEKKVPVAPDKTLFRLASVSKLFAATSVMQLAERGQLNLHDDVNKYLKHFQLQENYPAPVTFDNLLTHTSGFDERFIGLAARNPSEILPLGDYLAQQMPPRVMPPGKVIAYSNHGIALAGYLVEVISGLPFAQYIDEKVLQPLGMHKSSFLQPLPPALAPDLAVGYEYLHGSYQPIPSYYINDGPAGALKATATDISHFILAHLQNGRYGNTKILQEKTAIEMHSSHFTHHPRLTGWAYGFSERWQNNLCAIEHGGTDPGFASLLFLLPEQNLGFFVAYNNQQDELREQLVSQFLDRYYPVQQATISPQAIANSQQRAKYFVGSYRFIRYPRRTLEKLGPVLLKAPISAPELQVKVQGDSTLAIASSSYKSNRSPRRALNKVGSLLQGASTPPTSVDRAALESNQLVEVEPLLFQMSNGNYVAFKENDLGRITHMFIGADAYEKLAWYETTAFQLSLFGFCVLVFLVSCIVWLSRYFIFMQRQKFSFKLTIPSPVRLASSLLPIAISALNISFLLGIAFIVLLSNLYEFAYGLPPMLVALLQIPPLSAGMTLILPFSMLLAWQDKNWAIAGRLHEFLLLLAAWGFIFFLSYWNLLKTSF